VPSLLLALLLAPGIRADPWLDVPLTLGGATLWVATEVTKGTFAPSDCRWCQPNGFDTAVRDALKWGDPDAADMLSNIGAFAVAPILTVGGGAAVAVDSDGAANVPTDALVVSESAALAMVANQLVKFAVGRERPYVHASGASPGPDGDLSFYSGHTTFTFSLAVASGTVASLRGYRLAPVVWAAGLTTAAATGWLRIAADKHYATDVLTGAALGSAFGVVVPLLHRAPDAVAITPLPGGASVAFAW
jgi:membrane-associated phospholipid phosphatase